VSSWRNQILKEFIPKVARLTLVADPDGLLLEEGILAGIRDRGFELIPFEDHVAFRYAFESQFRSRWDNGEQTDLVVVLHSEAGDLGSLPYDLLQAGRRLFFSLGDIFPQLSYPVVDALDRGDLDALYAAQLVHLPGRLGDNATKEFILRHVFGIASELIRQPADLLRVLLRRHYQDQRIPPSLAARLIDLLRRNPTFDDWPLELLVSDREAFLTFLQERWPIFLDHANADATSELLEGGEPYGLAIEGPIDLPFGHHDVRVYIDNLFMEGLLEPVPHEVDAKLTKTWVGVGIRLDPAEDRTRRIAKLTESLAESLPAADTRYTAWLRFARSWAELIALRNEQTHLDGQEGYPAFPALQTQVDVRFTAWLTRRYASLINLPPVPPVMLHHLPRFLSRTITEDCAAKIALLVVDGLSMDQWLVIRKVLVSRSAAYRFREQSIFAWAPTITSVSRQAAFGGRPPLYFPDSIHATYKEPALWRQFWADQGLTAGQVAYEKGLGDAELDTLSEMLSHPKIRVAGLVIDKVDKIMHGMELGTAGMHNQVRQWAQRPYLSELLDLLLQRGFSVFLTSDHGNIEATGCGRPAEGAVADLRGERVRVYPNAVLRDKVKESFPTALAWEPVGLPDDYLPLLAPDRKAFITEDAGTVGHGGISIEELIVPLVRIERSDS